MNNSISVKNNVINRTKSVNTSNVEFTNISTTPAETVKLLTATTPSNAALGKPTRFYHFCNWISWACILFTVIFPVIFYVISQEQLFSKSNPSLTDWAAALSMAVFINTVALLCTIIVFTHAGFLYGIDTKGICSPLDDVACERKIKQYELLMRYLLIGLCINGTLLGYLHNTYIYAKQGVDLYPGRNLDGTFINIELLRTTGEVSYLENHICRFLNNLQNIFYWTVFFTAHLFIALFSDRKNKKD